MMCTRGHLARICATIRSSSSFAPAAASSCRLSSFCHRVFSLSRPNGCLSNSISLRRFQSLRKPACHRRSHLWQPGRRILSWLLWPLLLFAALHLHGRTPALGGGWRSTVDAADGAVDERSRSRPRARRPSSGRASSCRVLVGRRVRRKQRRGRGGPPRRCPQGVALQVQRLGAICF